MNNQGFCNLLQNRQVRVQATHRILKDHGYFLTSYLLHILLLLFEQIFAGPMDGTLRYFCRRAGKKLQNRITGN